jgi:hypothetical protein
MILLLNMLVPMPLIEATIKLLFFAINPVLVKKVAV